MSSLDIKFFLGVDGISLFLVVLTGVLFPLALFAAKPEHDEKGYYAWLTLLDGRAAWACSSPSTCSCSS